MAVTEPAVREALLVASPEFVAALDSSVATSDPARARKLEYSLARYFARLTSRPTPFGLFAGCSVGTIGPSTALELVSLDGYRRHTRLDMDYVTALTDLYHKDRSLWTSIMFFPNTSIYSTADRIHYVETRLIQNFRRHDLVSAEASCELNKILNMASGGVRIDELIAALIDDEITREVAEQFVTELIEGQLLVPEFLPSVTGREAIEGLIESLERSPSHTHAAVALQSVGGLMAELDAYPLGAAPLKEYDRIAAQTCEVFAPTRQSHLLQVDLFKPALQARIGRRVIKEIEAVTAALWLIRTPRDPLREFRRQFVERYEHRSRPLLNVLDPELGIGLPDPPATSQETAVATRRASLLAGLVQRALTAGSLEVELQTEDIEDLRVDHGLTPPQAFAANISLLAENAEAVDRGDFQLLWHGATGPSGASLLGRFCHLDKRLENLVAEHLRAEEALDDAIHAEVVHLPQGRIGNVVSRPRFREYEIPFLARSSAPPEKQIALNDLWVTVTRDDRIVLHSERLGREVRPCLTSAHAYDSFANLQLYRFLGLLQLRTAMFWEWHPINNAPFLPRVRYQRTILAPAKWHIQRRQADLLRKAGSAERFSLLQEWRQGRRVPRFISLAEGDNLLPLDIDSTLSVDSAFERVVTGSAINLVETTTCSDNSPVHSVDGRFANEIVIPFVRLASERAERDAERAALPILVHEPIRYPFGGEWQYLKLYTGPALADRVLVEYIMPMIERMKGLGVCDRWFFIRYHDPDFHIRLRIHGTAAALHAATPAVHEFLSSLHRSSLIWRAELATYEPEADRYGGEEAIRLAEDLFCLDSEALLEIIRAYPGASGRNARLLYTLGVISALISAFGATGRNRTELLREWVRFASHSQIKSWSSLYRLQRADIYAFFVTPDSTTAAACHSVLRAFEKNVCIIAERIRALEEEGRLNQPANALVASYTHMHANRSGMGLTREAETGLYDLLLRHDREAQARQAQVHAGA